MPNPIFTASTPSDAAPNGCGVALHPASCLCDVIIKEPCPVNYDLRRDIWHGKAIARALDYTGADDSREAFAEFAEAMMTAYDATQTARSMRDDWGVTRGTDHEGETRLKEVRTFVKQMLKSGHSILDVPALLEEALDEAFSFGQIVQALTGGEVSAWWAWSELDWLHAEGILQEAAGKLSPVEVGRALGFPQGPDERVSSKVRVETLIGWYGITLKPRASNRHSPTAKRRKEFVAKHMADHDDRELVYMIEEELGETVSESSVRNMRRRLAA